METTPLKNFATWARKELIREVTARTTAVLAPGSPERVERPGPVAALEKEVAASGGGDKGRAAVADKVAYTWFNRIIALRFMDANGYTGIGVVSPQAGVEDGQPEILAEAKRGVIDTEVASRATHTAVAALLDGTRKSDEPQGEAYSLLLVDYCRHWHTTMPFMFERDGDFTELLIPANLLANDSVLNRSRKVLTEEVCKDVEVIGWLYQFYISERKDEVFAGFKKNQKAGADEIPAATQLFTPDWIVRYLVENSLGRLWMLNHPSSRLVDRMGYYIAPVDEECGFLKISSPEELTVIDPACGSGHMLTYAFDLLYAIYEEEGYAPSEIPTRILTHNLHGTEIDPRAGALAAFALTMKARARQRAFFSKQIEPNICVIKPIMFTPGELEFLVTPDGGRQAEETFWNQFEHADTLGSLIQPDRVETATAENRAAALADHDDLFTVVILSRAIRVIEQANYLARKYAVVVANPPYMGSKNMDTRLAEFAKNRFPDGKSDLFAMFIERCLNFLPTNGLAGLMTPFVWMFLSTYLPLRQRLISSETISSLIQLEYSGFDGATVPICTYVLQRGRSRAEGAFVRLSDFVGPVVQGPKALEIIEADRSKCRGEATRGMEKHLYRLASSEFSKIPGSPIVYWLSPAMRAAFATGRPLGELAELREGMSTGDNETFMRLWWEVASSRSAFQCRTGDEAETTGAKWFPFNKGGAFRKWYGNQEYVVNWEHDGAAIRTYGSTDGGRPRSRAQNTQFFFLPSLSWSKISSGDASFRAYPEGFTFGSAAKSIYVDSERESALIMSICNSSLAQALLAAKSPTLSFLADDIGSLPTLLGDLPEETFSAISALTATSRLDWDSFETSWDFGSHPLLTVSGSRLAERAQQLFEAWGAAASEQQQREAENNRVVVEAYGLYGEVPIQVPLHRVSLTRNVQFRYGPGKTPVEYAALECADISAELVSYAVGCMFGRYSLDAPGLILADQGTRVQDYLKKAPSPTFAPDADNVIPIVDGEWFEDDIVERFRQFLRAAFGEQHFEENLRFVTESLGVKNLRDYFVKSFYKDHVQRYKKRPIYWMFASPKGSFNALVYMHRYTPSTVSTVLNEYLREFQAKLKASLEHAERSANAKEADRLRKILLELDDYEHDVLYPLASQNIAIDLDDGVKTNYPKFGAALKKIPGLEAEG